MTKINRISIHGFKSFAHKTEIPFDNKFNVILGPNGSGKCVTGNTIVQLANGQSMPIKELIEQKANHNVHQKIDDGYIYAGDDTEILCLNTENYNIEKRPIKSYVKRTAPEKLLKIKTRSGREVTSTPYHPLFILKEGKIVSARADELTEETKIAVPRQITTEPTTKIFFELLDEIKVEDNLYVPWSQELESAFRDRKTKQWVELTEQLNLPLHTIRSFFGKQAIRFAHIIKILRSLNYTDLEIIKLIQNVKAKAGNKIYPFPWRNSPELARLLGYLLAEGRLTASNQIWFTNGTEELVQDYVQLMKNVFDEKSTINEYKPNAWDVITYSKPLQIILSKLGLPLGGTTGNKTINNLFLAHSSNEELSELLNGLYCGDGYVSKNSIEITTKSKKLAFAIQTILTRLGLLYQSREVIKIATNTGFSGKYQQVNIYGKENFDLFAQNIIFIHPQKQERLIQLLQRTGNPNVDLIDANNLVKSTAQECNINVKKTKKEFAKIDAYCYNQCTPSRTGVQQLIEEVFLKSDSNQMQSLVQLQKLAFANVYWDEIVEIQEITPTEKWVYDLCVDEHHNFIANNIFVHNSNVGDALCFVLGRLSAKSMRAEKAVNLIFNGGKKRSPANNAAVEIAFCNKNKIFPEESAEVVINRAIKKNGTSVYRINGKRRTRTEVLDLLGNAKINPDGHNIVLQGDINRFVDMPHLERRKIIEQISDVTVYEEKKHKALLELNKVEEKLNNAQIILKERGVYLKELKKDRDQALRFKGLKDKIDSNKATFLHLQIEKKNKEQINHLQGVGTYKAKIKEAELEIEKLKSTVSSHKENISKINKQIEQKGEKEQLKVHRNIEDLKVNLAKNKTRISTLKDEINKINLRKDSFEEEINELQNKTSSHSEHQKEFSQSLIQKKKELQQAEGNISQFKKKHKIESSQEMEQELEQKDSLIEKKQDEVQQARQKQQELLREKDKFDYQLQTLDERLKKVKEIEQENKGQLKELQQKKSDFKSSTLRLNQCLDQDSSFASQISNARKKLTDLQEKQAELNARALSHKAGLSSNQAVKYILDQKMKGVHGTVADLGQVNKKFAQSLESAAGLRMQNIVVDNDKTAAECIKYLKEKKLGTASFIPLNKIKSRSISTEDKKLLKQDGVHGFALNVIQFQPQFKRAFEYVFGNTLLVEDIDTARAVGIGRIKMATLDGNLAEGSGVMRGGFMAKKFSLGFREKGSTEQLEKIENELGQLEGVISNVQTKREANEQEISTLRNQRAELEAEVIKLEKSLHLEDSDLNATTDLRKELTTNSKTVEQELAEVQTTISEINKELVELKSGKQKLRSQVSELRNPRLLAQLTAFEESRQKCREEIVRLEGELKSTSTQMDEMISPEIEKIQEILKQHHKEESEFSEEIKKLTAEVSQREQELERKEKESKEFYAKYKESFAQREELSSAVSKSENEMENIREKIRGRERELNLVSLKGAEIKARLAGMQEEFSKYKDVEIFKEKSPEELQREINKFESMMQQMSAVNMKALEVYEQVDTEFKKLIEKKTGLEKEKIDVHTLMNEIETKKKDHFMKTFDQANENFQRIFASLFKKGKAYLSLDNPQNPFDDGLSIKVKLSGKRFMDIKSLSGGEKTLTALSFIFAIQEYQPSSFYVLDEVDAALDKHNSETLSQLVRSYADGAQYLMISHNDAIISEADNLYGVSMNEGVSKVTSLKI